MGDEGAGRSRSRDPVTQRLLDQLYRARKRKGWTVRDLAREADISPSYVSLIENGHKVPDAATIERLGRALDLDEKLLGAWVTLRGRSADTREAIAAAQELAGQLGLYEADTRRMETPSMDMAMGPPQMPEAVMSMSYAPPPERRMREELGADLPDADRYVIGIPLVEEETEPVPGEKSRGRRPLWIDRRSLPEREELRGAFAWRLSPKGTERLRGIYRRGDMVVISPHAWSPDRINPQMVFAVRHEGRVVLTRMAWTGAQLVLLPEGSAPPQVVEAKGESALRRLVVGRVVLAVQRFR